MEETEFKYELIVSLLSEPPHSGFLLLVPVGIAVGLFIIFVLSIIQIVLYCLKKPKGRSTSNMQLYSSRSKPSL